MPQINKLVTQLQAEIPKRAGIVQGVVRCLAVGSRAEADAVDQLKAQPANSHHFARPGHQQLQEMVEVIRPVRDDDRIGIMCQIGLDMPCCVVAAELIVQRRRNKAQIGNDMLLHPGMKRVGQGQRAIEFFVAMLGDEREADERAAKAVELGIEEVAQEGDFSREGRSRRYGGGAPVRKAPLARSRPLP